MDKKIVNDNLIVKKSKTNGIFDSEALFDVINSPDFEDLFKMSKRAFGYYNVPDPILTKLLEEKGFSSLPIVVDSKHYKILLKSKLTAVYRGLKRADAIDDFSFNPNMHIGKGMYCNGIYFVYGHNAKHKAGQYISCKRSRNIFRKSKIDKTKGQVISGILPKDMKILDIDDGYKLRDKMIDSVDKLDLSSSSKQNLIRLLSKDVSISALLNNYDAVDIPNLNYLVILNKSKIYVKNDHRLEDYNNLKR